MDKSIVCGFFWATLYVAPRHGRVRVMVRVIMARVRARFLRLS